MLSLLSISTSLLIAFILSWFGFDKVVIKGMYELFDISITKTGYYFIFGLFGMAKSLLLSVGAGGKFRKDVELARDFRDAKIIRKRSNKFYDKSSR